MAVNVHIPYYRFGINSGTEVNHDWYAAINTDPRHTWGASTFLLRFTEQETGNTAASNIDATFQYKKNAGSWANITTTSSNVKAVNGILTNGGNCTKRLSGTGTFESSGAGQTEDGTSGGSANDIAALGNSETEIALQIVLADVADNDVLYFRITSPDTTFTMDVAPSVTVRIAAAVAAAASDSLTGSDGVAADLVEGPAKIAAAGSDSFIGSDTASATLDERQEIAATINEAVVAGDSAGGEEVGTPENIAASVSDNLKASSAASADVSMFMEFMSFMSFFGGMEHTRVRSRMIYSGSRWTERTAAIAGVATVSATSTDGVKAADIAEGGTVLYAEVTDGVKVSDVVEAAGVLLAAVSDGTKLADTAAVIGTLGATIADGAKISDTAALSGTLAVLAGDGIKLSDAGYSALVQLLAASDGIKATDAGAFEFTAIGNVTEGVKLSDAVTKAWQQFAAITDGIKVSDNAHRVYDGQIKIVFSGATATVTFTATRPTVSVAGATPTLVFTGTRPVVTASGTAPALTAV